MLRNTVNNRSLSSSNLFISKGSPCLMIWSFKFSLYKMYSSGDSIDALIVSIKYLCLGLTMYFTARFLLLSFSISDSTSTLKYPKFL